MAEDNPKGTATAIAIAEVKNVPFSSGQMPKWGSANRESIGYPEKTGLKKLLGKNPKFLGK
jgi:hypothetical protein